VSWDDAGAMKKFRVRSAGPNRIDRPVVVFYSASNILENSVNDSQRVMYYPATLSGGRSSQHVSRDQNRGAG